MQYKKFVAACVGLAFIASACASTDTSDWDSLASEYFAEVQECMSSRGEVPPTTPEEAGSDEFIGDQQRFAAYNDCSAELGESSRFAELGMSGVDEIDDEQRTEGYAAWKCIEEAGIARTAPIPLNRAEGWPLLPSPAYFDVPNDEQSINNFYEVAGGCWDMSVDDFRGPDGELGFGTTECQESDPAQCASTDNYPTE